MVGPLFGVSSEIIQISFHNPSDVMECVRHSPLKSGSNIFKAERHFPIGEGAPRADEGGLVLIFRLDLDLIIPRESIHKGEDFISSVIIQDLINEWYGIIVFRTCLIQSSKINTNSYFSFLLVYCNRVRNPFRQGDRIYKVGFQ